jgi:hypothetical protein
MAFETTNFDLAVTKLIHGCPVTYLGRYRASFEEVARLAGFDIIYSMAGVTGRPSAKGVARWHPKRLH